MRRIRLILAIAVAMAAMMVATAPAMANTNFGNGVTLVSNSSGGSGFENSSNIVSINSINGGIDGFGLGNDIEPEGGSIFIG